MILEDVEYSYCYTYVRTPFVKLIRTRGSVDCLFTVDHEIFAVKFFDNDLFQQKLNMRNILCNVRRPTPILVAKIWQRKLDYAKNLQAKYFTGENIPIYGTVVNRIQRMIQFKINVSNKQSTQLVHIHVTLNHPGGIHKH